MSTDSLAGPPSDPDHLWIRTSRLNEQVESYSDSTQCRIKFLVNVARYSDLWTASEAQLAKKVVQQVLASVCQVNSPLKNLRLITTITLADNNYLQKLNLKYCGKDMPTNVLAFPLFSPIPAASPAIFGEIVGAHQVIKSEAQMRNYDFKQYLTRILIHGTCHLLGYDHQNDQQEKLMLAQEKNLLALFNCAHLVI